MITCLMRKNVCRFLHLRRVSINTLQPSLFYALSVLALHDKEINIYSE